jgi:small-conductance mechanosensitive channel/CRP-like cAMP-binding protein
MSVLFDDAVSVWALVLIVLLPVLIVAGGELEERLRQRRSPLTEPVATMRTWVLGLVTLWVLVVMVFGVSASSVSARVLATAICVALVIASLQMLSFITDRAEQRAQLPGERGIPALLLLLPRLLVFLFAGWVIFAGIWNVDLTGLFAALGVTSLVVSLALQPTLSSLASGLLLLGDRPFSPGDWIRFDDTEGQVVDLGWRTSRIQDRNGDIHVVPNATLSTTNLINYAQPNELHRVVVPVQVAYSNPPTSAKEMLLAAARATEGVLESPPPNVRVKQIDDPLMGYEAHLWIDDYAIAPRVFSDFGSLVWYQSNRMDVPLPSPAYDLYHHDPIQEAADAEVGFEERKERIRQSPQLRDLSDGDLGRLASAARAVRFSRGERMVPQEDGSTDTFVLFEGTARIVDPLRTTRFVELSAGDVFGVLGRSSDSGLSPEVVAMTDCEVLIVSAEAAGAVISRNPALNEALNRLDVSRLRRLDPTESVSVGPRENLNGDTGSTDPSTADTGAQESPHDE